MGYKRIIVVDILEICRRYFAGESINSISKQVSIDRKTVRKYIQKVKGFGIEKYDKEKIISLGGEMINKQSGRPKSQQSKLERYQEEIQKLLEKEFKLTTIHEILVERDEIDISYSSLKRFVRSNHLRTSTDKTTCRMPEKEPGLELQVDYAKVGMLYDPITKKRRTTYAFIGTLSSSRHKFVEFVNSQNQQSFVQSHVKMFNYFGAVPKIIIIDNLKSGVIKPDLYDPKLNKAYAEMAEHYECFINPARVATPKDKPIVERDVQTVREQFKKMKELNENLSLEEVNKSIKDWLLNKYGLRDHGTTGERPYEFFINNEKDKMLPLPAAVFEAAIWKQASVHPDHYIQVNKKAYSIPHRYVGQKVWAKITSKMVYIYYDDKLIKRHVIPSGYRQTDFNDFPENMKEAIKSGMPGYLLNQAKNISGELGKLVWKILIPHAYINMRKAQGIIRIAEKFNSDIIDRVSIIAMENHKRITPKIFMRIIEDINTVTTERQENIPVSEETSSFLRDTEYFIHNN